MEGIWVRKDSVSYDYSQLDIKEDTPERVRFSIDTFNDNMGNTGIDIEHQDAAEFAFFSKENPNSATFTEKADIDSNNKNPCVLTFTKSKNHIDMTDIFSERPNAFKNFKDLVEEHMRNYTGGLGMFDTYKGTELSADV